MKDEPFKALSALRALLDERCTLTSTARLVALALARRSNARGECYPSIDTLAGDTGLSRRTVAKAIAEIEGDANSPVLLTRAHRGRADGSGGRSSNLYRMRLNLNAPRALNSDQVNGTTCTQPGGDLSAPEEDLSANRGDLSAPAAQDLPREAAKRTAQVLEPFSKPLRKKSRRKPETPIPAGFGADDALLAWASKELGFDGARVRAELAKFVDHAHEKDRRARDWTAALRRWLRNAKGWERPNTNGARSGAIPRQPGRWLGNGEGSES